MWLDDLIELGGYLDKSSLGTKEKLILENREKLFYSRLGCKTLEEVLKKITKEIKIAEGQGLERIKEQTDFKNMSKDSIKKFMKELIGILILRKEIKSPIKFLKEDLLSELSS